MSRPSNADNDGRAFESIIERTADAYFQKRVLRLAKVEPPVRVIGWGKNQKIIFLENPFPDWTGAWTERQGRSLMIESKSTTGDQLRLGTGHLTLNQIQWLKRWHAEGSAVGVVWEWRGHGYVFLPIGQVWSIYESGRRHIKFAEGDPISQGQGFILCDFAANLRRWYP